MTTQPASRTRPVTLPAALTVRELGDILAVSPVEIIKRLMTHGVMAAVNATKGEKKSRGKHKKAKKEKGKKK